MEKQRILEEIEQFTGDVNPELKKYIAEIIFPQ